MRPRAMFSTSTRPSSVPPSLPWRPFSCAVIHSFMRWQSLRKRVKDVGYKIDDTVELTNLFNAVKHSFPNEALLWAADMNKNKLTTITFLARLSTLANTQKNYTNMVAAKVEVKTKDTTKEVKTETNGDERVTCDVCGKKIYKNLKHFLCGYHRVPGTTDCWWCDPYKAPDTLDQQEEGDRLAQEHQNHGRHRGQQQQHQQPAYDRWRQLQPDLWPGRTVV
ncbi:hypothetical protein SMAC4_13537 [Sordaria macrospora]|uniref:uncharacterized protein n=1 Tax=Sordaria macrospora TaxID=5147 RepID=UPI002B2E431A|nr:hypothetical protein SMAC4_13537 [Sordaria macrospora]